MSSETLPAIAAFVKTPGVSPIKARLIEGGMDPHLATEFYQLALRSVEELMQAVSSRLQPYWAVAEEKGLTHRRWSGFERVFQGEGKAASRLVNVHQLLSVKHPVQLFIADDVPQLMVEHVYAAISMLERSDFVLGRTLDGGVYLFGSRKPIDERLLSDVALGTTDGARGLLQALAKSGSVSLDLPVLSDVDHPEDMLLLEEALTALTRPRPSQTAILDWLKS